MKTTDLTGKGYPDNVDATPESSERPVNDDTILQPPKGGQGATSPPDDDTEWDLPSDVGASPSPTL